jgi:hypothetical protein
MSKILNVSDSNYKVKVASGGTITFDTGAEVGTVVVTGNIQIQGTTTTVNSADLIIDDNIIVINNGETGAGITLNTAGIQIDRGTEDDAFLIFDENTTHNDPVSQTNRPGTFIFKDNSNSIRGIKTNSITTGGSDLYLINAGTNVVSVSGTADYENQVTDDDDLPNKKYVDDAITTGIQTITIQSIQRGDSALNLYDSSLDSGVTPDSEFRVTIDGTIVSSFKSDQITLENVKFTDNTISTNSGNLILSSAGSAFIEVDGILRMPLQEDSSAIASDPSKISLYGKDPNIGNTGVWYKNKYDYEDELISTNRSLMFSMLF